MERKKTSNESENSATIQWKQKLKILDYVLNDNGPPQAERNFEYNDSKKKVKIE